MARYNLLTEPWIVVMRADSGTTETVSMLDLFKNAHKYRRLAGDTKTQDFAVFRVLLAVLHTVFSRFDARGDEHGFCTLDEKYKPLSDIDEYYADDYEECLYETWVNLWSRGSFPDIVGEYLLKWHDSFYLFDDKLPFFQVTAENIEPSKISKAQASSVSGKNMNRLISESGNKISLFSPKYEYANNKEYLDEPQIARWLITLQSYIGLSDKVIFGSEKYKASKGWLFDIGGISLRVENLFNTLLLNCVAAHSDERYWGKQQRPCWEYNSSEVLSCLMLEKEIDNLAELYTNWARAIYIDPDIDVSTPFSCDIVKLPEINHQNNFLEPMTLWRYNESGPNKGTFTPRKHQALRSVWRSFGLITLPNSEDNQRKPELLTWLDTVRETVGDVDLSVEAISMEDDGNATSWVPVDQICDSLRINNYILTDTDKDGWVIRINDVVETTKEVAYTTYRRFIFDVKKIRNIESNDFVNNKVEELYGSIDLPFRFWLSNINKNTSMNEAVLSWYEQLYWLTFEHAKDFVGEAGARDYMGIIQDERTLNIATAFNRFEYFLRKKILN